MNFNHRKQKYLVIILAGVICQLSFNSVVLAAKYNFLDEKKIQGKDSDFTISPLQWNSWNDDKLADQTVQLNYLQAIDYLKQNKIDKAKKIINELLSQHPNDTRYINLNAVLKILTKDITAAKYQYQKALKLESKNLTALLGLAKLSLQEGKFEQAEKDAEKALVVDNKLVLAYFILAESAYKQGAFEKVEHILIKGLTSVQGNLESELQIVDVLRHFYGSQQKIKKLSPIIQAIVKRYPDEIPALTTLVVTQLANKQITLAEQTLIQIINLEPQDTNHRLLLADLLNNSANKENEVLKLLNEVLLIQANNLQALKFLVKLQIKQEQYQLALETIDRINGFFPQKGVANELEGEVYVAKKEYAKALQFYNLAYLKENSNEILFVTADLLKMQNQQQAALDLLHNELKINSQNIAVHFKLASLYHQSKNYQQAEIHYNNILQQQTNNLLALNNQAWVYSQQNKTEALDLAKRAYDIAPQSADIADTYAMILIKQGDKKLGLSIIEKAAENTPDSNELQYHLALAHSVNGNSIKAIKILQQIENSENDFSEKQKALELLKKLQQD